MHKKSLEPISGIRCPRWKDDQPCWIWKAWIDLLSSGLAIENSGTPRPCRVTKPKPWIPSQPGIIVTIDHYISPSESHPGPKSGGRPNPNVPHGAQNQSTGARATGDCHSPVGPKVPHAGTDGKPWHEHHTQLVSVGTAPDGSLQWWPIFGHRKMTIFPQLDWTCPRTHQSATRRAESELSGTYTAPDNPRSYLFSDCRRKLIFCLIYMSRVPIRLIGPVAPALHHLTRSMDVQSTRSLCCRSSWIDSQQLAPSQAPGTPARCSVSISSHRCRHSLDTYKARPTCSSVASGAPSTQTSCLDLGRRPWCHRVLQALCLLSGPLPVAGGGTLATLPARPQNSVPCSRYHPCKPAGCPIAQLSQKEGIQESGTASFSEPRSAHHVSRSCMHLTAAVPRIPRTTTSPYASETSSVAGPATKSDQASCSVLECWRPFL